MAGRRASAHLPGPGRRLAAGVLVGRRRIVAYAKTSEKGASGLMVHGTFEAGHGEKAPPRCAAPKTGLISCARGAPR
jgi:hypothetical protein